MGRGKGKEGLGHHEERQRRPRAKRIPWVPNTVKLLLFVLLVSFVLAVRAGYVPARYSPFAPVDLADPSGWFIDWRLSTLDDDRNACRRLLRPPHIVAEPVAALHGRGGCGWSNGFRVARAGGVRLSPHLRMTCPLAAALALWLEHRVQPAAKKYLGTRVTALHHVGGYSCRNIRGSIGRYFDILSEHAKANAIDITGFSLANGARVSVQRDWPRKGPKAAFLRTVHDSACGFFRVTLGPDANKLHRDHFHLDRGFLRACR